MTAFLIRVSGPLAAMLAATLVLVPMLPQYDRAWALFLASVTFAILITLTGIIAWIKTKQPGHSSKRFVGLWTLCIFGIAFGSLAAVGFTIHELGLSSISLVASLAFFTVAAMIVWFRR